MNGKEREKLRKLQNKVLDSGKTKEYIKKHGYDFPLFGNGSPTANSLAVYLYPSFRDRMEQVIA